MAQPPRPGDDRSPASRCGHGRRGFAIHHRSGGRKAFPPYADKCQTVYNGVDIEKFHPTTSEQGRPAAGARLIFIGRVSPEKGLHVLVDAIRKVRERFPDAHLDVLGGEHVQPKAFYLAAEGDNPLLKSLEPFYHAGSYMQQMKVRSGGEGNGITFHGDVDHAKIAQILTTADLFVQPSVWNDPSPLTLYEAMAAGLPVVATRVGGQPEIVEDGRTGLIVNSNDAAGWRRRSSACWKMIRPAPPWAKPADGEHAHPSPGNMWPTSCSATTNSSSIAVRLTQPTPPSS